MPSHHPLAPTTRLKSPMYGGFRGPTPPQPHRHPIASQQKSPHHWGDLGGPSPIPATHPHTGSSHPGKEGRKLNQKNKPTSPRNPLTRNSPTHLHRQPPPASLPTKQRAGQFTYPARPNLRPCVTRPYGRYPPAGRSSGRIPSVPQ